MDLRPLAPDRIDAELIEDTLRTPGYALIEKRIREEAARKVRSLIDHGQEVDRTRGMVQGLELALDIPRIISREGRGEQTAKQPRNRRGNARKD